VAVSASDPSKVAVAHADGAVVVWDLRFVSQRGGQPVRTAAAPHGVEAGQLPSRHRSRLPASESLKGASLALTFHPRDASALLSGGSDGTLRLVDLGAATVPVATCAVLGRATVASHKGYGMGALSIPRPRCVGIGFDAAASYLAAAFDNEAVALCSRHPRLAAGARLA
jgi:hypothetical protein